MLFIKESLENFIKCREGIVNMEIAAVVVLYNPDNGMFDNLLTYMNQVKKIYVIDNSDCKNINYLKNLKKYEKVKYFDNGGNKGIAAALNIGAGLAIQDGYQWLLTMDQDSKATTHMIKIMENYINKNSDQKLGIVAAYPLRPYEKHRNLLKRKRNRYEVITSGNLVNVQAYHAVGGWEDKLFIDYVDTDFCLRLRQAGYQVIQCEDALLKHNLGNNTTHLECGCYLNRSPQRIFYTVRNGCYIIKKYRDFSPNHIAEFKRIVIKSVFYELLYGNRKLVKMLCVIRGYYAFRKGIYGKQEIFICRRS